MKVEHPYDTLNPAAWIVIHVRPTGSQVPTENWSVTEMWEDRVEGREMDGFSTWKEAYEQADRWTQDYKYSQWVVKPYIQVHSYDPNNPFRELPSVVDAIKGREKEAREGIAFKRARKLAKRQKRKKKTEKQKMKEAEALRLSVKKADEVVFF